MNRIRIIAGLITMQAITNPVRAGLVKDAADWVWSSYLATAGKIEGLTLSV